MARVIDFDAFRAEQAHEPISLIVGGRTYELPWGLPATIALDVLRLNETIAQGAEVGPEDLMRIGAALFGGDAPFREVLAGAGITMDELPDFIRLVMEAYAPNPETQELTPASL